MLKSINNVSRELGISKATIYKRLKEEKYKKLIIKENNVIKINEMLYELLKNNTKRKNIEEAESVEIVNKGACAVNIEASIEYLWSSSLGQDYYNKCSYVNSFLSGLYFGNDWTQTSYSSNIVDSGRQLDVTVNGKFDYYILINTSLTSFAGQQKSYSVSWRNP